MSNYPDFSSHGYQVIRELGHNRAGGRVTYLAKNKITQQPIVIKQFQFAQSGADWSGFKACEREIQILHSLAHPAIPRYLDAFETAKGFCMVQEYKDAPSLAVSRSFEPQEIRQIAIAVLEILAYLQNQTPPIIHRDIKPENILVDDKLNVYLVDFGFARIGGGEGAMSSVAAGTFGFMAPEQIYNRQLSLATDLYGLGATLICLLTGIKSTEIDTLIDEDNCLNFKPLVPQLTLTWLDWLEKMVQPNQKDRFPSAGAAIAALQHIYISSIPEVQLSGASLAFKATKLAQKLTQTLRISNYLPDSVLEGSWEVAPHPSDPPHQPSIHAWISFDPARFDRDRAECKITVDTSKLMASQIYDRQIFLHANSVPETNYALSVKVQTAPLPRESNKQLYSFLGWLLAIAWVSAACLAGDAGWVRNTAELAVFVAGAMFGARSGWEAVKFAFWVEGIPLALMGAVAFYVMNYDMASSDVSRGIFSDVSYSVGNFVDRALHIALRAIAGVILGAVARAALRSYLKRFVVALKRLFKPEYIFRNGKLPAAFKRTKAEAESANKAKDSAQAVPGATFWKEFKTEFGTLFAGAILVLTAALGVSLGIGVKVGFLNSLIISAVLVTGLPLVLTIGYLHLLRARLFAKYRQSEQYLIKP